MFGIVAERICEMMVILLIGVATYMVVKISGLKGDDSYGEGCRLD